MIAKKATFQTQVGEVRESPLIAVLVDLETKTKEIEKKIAVLQTQLAPVSILCCKDNGQKRPELLSPQPAESPIRARIVKTLECLASCCITLDQIMLDIEI